MKEFPVLDNNITIRTTIDDLLDYCESLRETDINFLTTLIKIPRGLIEYWLLILEEKGIVELKYTFTNIKVKINGRH